MTLKAASFLACLTAMPAFAEAPALPEPAEVELLSGWRMENGNHMAALRVTLSDGWKTYWRAPGEGGVPPEIDWTGSENIGGVAYHWPVPEVIDSGGMTTVGYHHELVLPLEITPEDPGADVLIDADVLMGICEHICVPLQVEVGAVLPVSAVAEDALIRRALDARPDTPEEAGLDAVSCTSESLSDGVRVTATLDLPALGAEEWVVFEEADPNIWVSEAILEREGDILTAFADFVPPDAQPYPVDGSALRLTVLGAGRAVDIAGCAIVD